MQNKLYETIKQQPTKLQAFNLTSNSSSHFIKPLKKILKNKTREEIEK